MTTVVDRRAKYDGTPRTKAKTTYVPLNDRVLLRRVEDKTDSLVQIADTYQQPSNKGEVVAVGDGMLLGNHLVPIPLKPGDVCLFGNFNAEEITLDGDDFILVSAWDIRLKLVK
jgi:chaperonin GroES